MKSRGPLGANAALLISARALPLACLFAALAGNVSAAQHWRDDWKPGSAYDVDARLIYSLADAPLSGKEREQIYLLIDNQVVHDSFTDAQRDEERETVMSARLGFIELANNGSQQVLVQGPRLFCGANGNCSYWVFIRHHGQLRLILDAAGAFLVRNTSSHGFHDVATSWHMSAYEGVYTDYRWDGTKYAKVDCYTSKWDRDYPVETPVISGCGE